ncbi:hypothetical protein LTR56_011182 [Elasticomyces elasticus]|nr:hypothetical protein LTR56_011182 [Elasticomyces elasticus]KAK4921814.1 hypothetical protein LTR49_010752 [Elasticomyces elasticus]KAK5753422.1 hypothetical protein LTS12_016473 [Elasticomyces elasticus]
MAISQRTAADTLALLEDRLRRVNYVLNGDSETNEQQPTSSATARLRALERSLAQLRNQSPAVAEVLALQKARPAVFNPSAAETPSIPANQLTALILAHSQLYTSVSGSLTQLQSTQLPDSAVLVKLVDLGPRMERVLARQEQQAREVSELRARSARVVEQWLEVGMLGMSERWAEWEERLKDVEVVVRRREGVRKREEGVV